MPKIRPVDVVFEPVVRSKAMRDVDHLLRALAPNDVGMTMTGENGTGKEVLARRIHDLSQRRSGPFVPIDCAAVPEPLFESELFGHEKGAFTGATERTIGKIEAAHGGTLLGAVLRAENGNRSRTARRLGISLRTVQRYCKSI